MTVPGESRRCAKDFEAKVSNPRFIRKSALTLSLPLSTVNALSLTAPPSGPRRGTSEGSVWRA